MLFIFYYFYGGSIEKNFYFLLLAMTNTSVFAQADTSQIPVLADLTFASDVMLSVSSKAGTKDNPKSYNIKTPFKKIGGNCYAENKYVTLRDNYGMGYGNFIIPCSNTELNPGDAYSQNMLSAYSTMNQVALSHERVFGSKFFSESTAFIYHDKSRAVNSSYVPSSDAFSDAFFIRTNAGGDFDSAYVDLTTMAHEAGHKHTNSLLELKNTSVFVEAFKEAIADIYSVVIHDDYLGSSNSNDRWLVVLRGTGNTSSGAIRDIAFPQNDYPAPGVVNGKDMSSNKTPYQNGGFIRSSFYDMYLLLSNGRTEQESKIVLKDLYLSFRTAGMKLNGNENAQEYSEILKLEISKRPSTNKVNLESVFLDRGWY